LFLVPILTNDQPSSQSIDFNTTVTTTILQRTTVFTMYIQSQALQWFKVFVCVPLLGALDNGLYCDWLLFQISFSYLCSLYER